VLFNRAAFAGFQDATGVRDACAISAIHFQILPRCQVYCVNVSGRSAWQSMFVWAVVHPPNKGWKTKSPVTRLINIFPTALIHQDWAFTVVEVVCA